MAECGDDEIECGGSGRFVDRTWGIGGDEWGVIERSTAALDAQTLNQEIVSHPCFYMHIYINIIISSPCVPKSVSMSSLSKIPIRVSEV